MALPQSAVVIADTHWISVKPERDYECGNNSACRADTAVDRCRPQLASQSRLGLWSEQRYRCGRAGPGYLATYGKSLMNDYRSKDVSIDAASKQFASDFRAVVADAEALIEATANQGDEKLIEIRSKAQESVRLAKATLEEMQAAMMVKSKEAADALDVYVHESPWQSIGIAAGVGVAIGLMLRSR
jgi:ElaB/YqjD/DUF883 family membrane-anchored ribosome-binding protein